MAGENKKKFALWIHPSVLERVGEAAPKDNCASQCKFIEKAVKFYLGYLAGQNALDTYAPILSSIIQSSVRACEDRLSRNMFKLAVEQAKLSHLFGAFHEVDEGVMRRLQAKCAEDVKHLNGLIRFEDAYRFQKVGNKE